jgi:2-amino-4-hydroxy-6-hydroxymethyldihydropteridine diphosphokinase
VPTPARVFIALGSNLGDRAAHLAVGLARLGALPGTRLVAASRVEETLPLGPIPQGPYLNQMALFDTTLEPEALLDHCIMIERDAGRVRRERWGPRTLDLDIVRYGDLAIRTPRLTVPHPELPNRAFWIRELAELDALAPPAVPLHG